MNAAPRLDDLRMLAAVIEHGSFRAAAAHSGTSQPRVSRAVKRLEERLGRVLIRRNPRSVAPTALGLRYAAHARRLLAELAEAEVELLGGGEMAGPLSVSAPPALGRRLLAPALGAFCEAHPEVRLDLSLRAAQVDLIADNVDLAIRFGPISETWQRSRRLLRGRYHLYGVPALAQADESLEALLERTPCLVLHVTHLRDRWPFLEGRRVRWIPVRPALLCDDVGALIELTVAGLGVTMMPDFLVRAEVEQGKLVRLTSGASATPAEVFAVTDSQPSPTRVRRLVEHLAAALKD